MIFCFKYDLVHNCPQQNKFYFQINGTEFRMNSCSHRFQTEAEGFWPRFQTEATIYILPMPNLIFTSLSLH